nr:MAG TPA: hypothetical protein [Caudoviricetes sp.]
MVDTPSERYEILPSMLIIKRFHPLDTGECLFIHGGRYS